MICPLDNEECNVGSDCAIYDQCNMEKEMNYFNSPNCATNNCPAAVENAALRKDASSKWAFLEWRDRAEKAEGANAALREQLDVCKAALRELDLTGIQYQEKPVDAVGRMRGIAMAALKRLM